MKSLKNTAEGTVEKFSAYSSSLLPALAVTLLLLFWEAAVYISQIERWILPAPSAVASSLFSMDTGIWGHIGHTAAEAAAGLILAVIAAFFISVMIDSSTIMKRAIYPLLVISQTVPIIALAPLFIIWFGFGMLPKIMVVALVCFFPITINTVEGLRLVDRDMLKLMNTMGATGKQIFLKVKLPSALPHFFSGLKIAGTYSVMGAVIGEWLGSSKGLGILLTRSSQSFLTERVFAIIFLIVMLSLAVFSLIEYIAKLSMPWKTKELKYRK
ncbi:ABC transporter permease subunit [Bacillus lacus]|uniref:ABC transporter permease subunit n=1 Tax=Metabacillus lacus TaxID=1983721 RepID=A0A7X2J261_9BACI|nr:ABC transporter permease [Metabacillus lacus]MRX74086.1 ABC transporter permease subunit [Metabacillus lacus]